MVAGWASVSCSFSSASFMASGKVQLNIVGAQEKGIDGDLGSRHSLSAPEVLTGAAAITRSLQNRSSHTAGFG